MLLYIDPLAGSKKLLDKFPGESEPMLLEGGDVAFWGIGPNDEPWWIGLEYKQLDDIVACVKSGRFTGTQLPKMMRMYDQSFLLIEGILRPDRNTGQLVRYRGKATYGLGLSFKAFDNYLTSVSVFSALCGKPCVIKMAATDFETVQIIRDIYSLFQKPWDQHNAISRPDKTKIERISYDLEVLQIKPADDSYPKNILRKAIFQVDGVGWEIAGVIAEKFGTMQIALTAGQKEWQTIEHIGGVLADRIYRALHGYSDPDAAKKKRKSKEIV